MHPENPSTPLNTVQPSDNYPLLSLTPIVETPSVTPPETVRQKLLHFWTVHKIKIIVAIIVLILIYLLFVRTGFLTRLFRSVHDHLEHLKKEHPHLVLLLLFLIVVFVVCTMVFSHAAICMLVATILGNFSLSIFLLIFASMTGSALIYFLSKPLCARFILSKISQSDYYLVLQKESRVNPWSTAFGTRLLFIPAGSKDYILTMIDNPPIPYFVSCFCVHLFYIIESCLIAQQITEMGGDNAKTWSQKTPLEKFFSVSILVIIIFTVGFIIFLGNYVTKKINEKKLESQEIEMREQLIVRNEI